MKVKNTDEIVKTVQSHDYDHKRIFSIVAHIHHGKTSISDFLLKRAGLVRPEDAGLLMSLNFDPGEQQREITIFNHVVLLAFEDKRQKDSPTYIFQINDTPGHLSFTGEVSRALRGSDGAIIVVDGLEGIMTQTETNIKLAVGEERCKPVLFLNKVDRLITQLKLSPADAFKRIDTIINGVNDLIREYTPEGFNWTVSFAKNQVAVGSAKDGWAFNMEILKENNWKPQLVFEKYAAGEMDWLRKNLPMDEVVLRMVIDFCPNPKEASIYRIPHFAPTIDKESEIYKSLLNSDPNGPLFGMVTKVFIDPKSGRPTLIGRIYSGTLRTGDSIYLVNRHETQRIKRLGVQEIGDILDMDFVPAGNLFAIFGFICPAGESFVLDSYAKTFADRDDIPRFESIKYSCEAVCSRSISPKKSEDIGKLGDVVSKWIMSDNTAKYTFNKESKEFVLSGVDPFQITILTEKISEQVEIKISDPIIVYREMPTQRGQEFHTKSPNGHNKMIIYVEPLDPIATQLILDGTINEMQDNKTMTKILADKAKWDPKEARKIWDVYEGNVFIDGSKGLQRIDRIKSYVIGAFRDWVSQGPLAKEPITGCKVIFTDCSVHVDPAHCGYGEIATMVTAGMALSFLTAKPLVYEPIQVIDIKTPNGSEGSVTKVLGQHRAQIMEISSEGANARIRGKIPASETVNISDELRGETQGRAFFGYTFSGFEPIPTRLQEQFIMTIRKRKKMELAMPTGENFKRFIYVRT
jgi:elongation factor 2